MTLYNLLLKLGYANLTVSLPPTLLTLKLSEIRFILTSVESLE